MASIWNVALKQEAIKLYETHSAAEMVVAFRKKGLNISRNSIIGMLFRAGKTGLEISKQKKNRVTNLARAERQASRICERRGVPFKRALRIVASNGNSNQMRVIETMVRKPREAPAVVAEPRNLTFAELEPNDCRYPYGGFDKPILFCGHPKQEGSSYCPPHHALCWTPPTARRSA